MRFVCLVVAVLAFAAVVANLVFESLALMVAAAVVTAYAVMIAVDLYVADFQEAQRSEDGRSD